MKKIIFWGATGQSIVLEEMLAGYEYQLAAIVDNDPKAISPFKEFTVFYGKAAFEKWYSYEACSMHFAVAIGGDKGADRIEIGNYLEQMGLIPANLFHPTSYISESTSIGKGIQILAQSAICARVQLGNYVIINTAASVDHESIIGDGVHIGPGVKLAGCVEIGENSFLGTGAIVLPRIKIGKNVIVGAGSIVTKNIPDNVVCYGNPAKVISQRNFNLTMNPIDEFYKEKSENISKMSEVQELQQSGLEFLIKTAPYKYSYNFSWMGRPIIAYPQDMIAMQEIIWEVKPDLIIETGVAHGGSIVYYASLLELIGNDGIVLGIDIDIRKHNRDLIEAHSMFRRIRLIEGSSTSRYIVDQVKMIAAGRKKILICLDSNHTHEHVLEELKLYAPLTSIGSYCVVFDTVVEDMPEDYDWKGRPWGKGNNPKTALWEFLRINSQFIVDSSIHSKLLVTVAPEGFLKRVR